MQQSPDRMTNMLLLFFILADNNSAVVIAALAALGGAIAAPLIGKLIPTRKPKPDREQAIDKRVNDFIELMTRENTNQRDLIDRQAARITELENQLGSVQTELSQWRAGLRILPKEKV